MAVVCTIFVLPAIMFAELILVPGFAVWLSMFEQFDDSLMDLLIAKPDNYTTNLVGLLTVTGAPLVLMYLMYRVMKISYKNSIWIINRFKLKPQMNLVLFNNRKKFYEFKI